MDFLRNQLQSRNDSIMTLLCSSRSINSLVIAPENYGNLARFVSGVNETDKKSLAKINVPII